MKLKTGNRLHGRITCGAWFLAIVAAACVWMQTTPAMAQAFVVTKGPGPSFAPSVPSSQYGDVEYEYTRAFCSQQFYQCIELDAHFLSHTEQKGTYVDQNGVTQEINNGIGEIYDHYLTVNGFCGPVLLWDDCIQSFDAKRNPQYIPSSGTAECAFQGGTVYNYARLCGPSCDVITEHFADPAGHWTLDYTHPMQLPCAPYSFQLPCDCGLGHLTLGGSGYSSYYKIKVHVDHGTAPPNLPALPDPGTATTTTEGEDFPPYVTIGSPRNGNEFCAPASIDIKIFAFANGGTISQVQVYRDGNPIPLGVATPTGNGFYSYTWYSPSPGDHTLTAKATDNNNIVTTSDPVTIVVRADSPSGMVGWWKAEYDANDSIYGNNGTLNGTGFADGKVGQAFSFDGNDYVDVPSSGALKFTGPFSIEGWIKYDSLTGANGDAIVTKGIDDEVAVDWTLTVSSNHKLRPAVNAGGTWCWFDCNTTLIAGTWYHVAMVYDGSRLKGYVNGVLDETQPHYLSGPVQATDYSMKIGAYAPVGGTASKAFFAGRIDELSLYNRALSIDEISAIYQAASAGKCPPSTTPPSPSVPTVSIAPDSTSVYEGNTIGLTVSRSGPTTSPLTVWLHQDGYVVDPACYFDFDFSDATVEQVYIVFYDLVSVVIPAGASEKTFYLNATPDSLTEDAENATLLLVEDPSYGIDPSASQSVVTIYDN